MFETVKTVISVVGTAKQVYDTAKDAYEMYKGVGAILKGERKGDPLDRIASQIEQLNTKIERLDDRILYAQDLRAVQDTSVPRQRYLDDLREVRASLEPVQRAIGAEILSSALILTPEKMQKSLARNPWDVLMDVRPVNLFNTRLPPEGLPVLFEHSGVQYMGWQVRGIIEIVFDCRYEELWVPRSPPPAVETREPLITRLSQTIRQVVRGSETRPVVAPSPSPSPQIRGTDERGTPLTFATMKAGQKVTVTVYEKVFVIKGTQLVMIYVPEGEWKYGNKPAHLKPFYMGKFPITQKQYQAVMGNNPSGFKGNDNLPVEQVSWLEAVEFCKKLSQLTGKTCRLPTEAEWEYAARAGTETEYWWGNKMDDKRCWYDENSGNKTHPVDEKVNEHTNPFGLCDMLGNVWEWTCSEYTGSYNGKEQECISNNRAKNNNMSHGGSWNYDADSCRVADRFNDSPSGSRGSSRGFRVVMLPP